MYQKIISNEKITNVIDLAVNMVIESSNNIIITTKAESTINES